MVESLIGCGAASFFVLFLFIVFRRPRPRLKITSLRDGDQVYPVTLVEGTLQGQANPWEVQVYVYSRDGRWWSQGKPLAIGGTRWSSVCHFGTNAPDGTHYRVVAVLGGPAGSAATKSLPQGDVVVASDTIEVVLKKA